MRDLRRVREIFGGVIEGERGERMRRDKGTEEIKLDSEDVGREIPLVGVVLVKIG